MGSPLINVYNTQVAVENVLLNHAWRHLMGSPEAHFEKTLLTRCEVSRWHADPTAPNYSTLHSTQML